MTSGAEFVGESFILLVSGGWLLYEYNQSNEKAAIKEEQYRQKTQAERMELQAKLHALDVRLKAVEDVVSQKSLLPLPGQQQYKAPDKKHIVPISDHKGVDPEIDQAGERVLDLTKETGTSDHAEMPAGSNNREGWRKWIPW